MKFRHFPLRETDRRRAPHLRASMPPRSEVDDRQALSIYLALNVLLAYFFTQLLDVHASIYPALLPRVAR